VLLFREQELYTMTEFVNRYTKEPVRFVVGLSLLIRAWEDRYRKLGGRLLEALSRLFAQNVRIYIYPMTVADLQQSILSLSATRWEWSEMNGWVSARQLRPAVPLGHLYGYALQRLPRPDADSSALTATPSFVQFLSWRPPDSHLIREKQCRSAKLENATWKVSCLQFGCIGLG
jgi:hypothetical protein